jgi:hypothetical protein
VLETDRPGAAVTEMRMGKGFARDLDAVRMVGVIGAVVAKGSTNSEFTKILSNMKG